MKKKSMLSRLKATLLLSISVCLISCANSEFLLDRGKKSYDEHLYRQAFIRLKPVAEAGNAEAQYAISYMYFNGQGVTEDKKVAIVWMKESAAQGNIKAINALKIINSTPPSPYEPKGRSIIGNGR